MKKFKIYTGNESLMILISMFIKDGMKFEFVPSKSSGNNSIIISIDTDIENVKSVVREEIGNDNFSIYEEQN